MPANMATTKRRLFTHKIRRRASEILLENREHREGGMTPRHHLPDDNATATAWLKNHGIGAGNPADESLALRWDGTAWSTPDWYRVVYRLGMKAARTPEIEAATGKTRGGILKVKAKYRSAGVEFPYVSRNTNQYLANASAAAIERAAYKPVVVRGTNPDTGARTTVHTDSEAQGVDMLGTLRAVRDG